MINGGQLTKNALTKNALKGADAQFCLSKGKGEVSGTGGIKVPRRGAGLIMGGTPMPRERGQAIAGRFLGPGEAGIFFDAGF